MKNKIINGIIVLCGIVIIIVFMHQCDTINKLKEETNLHEHANDSITYYKNKWNESVASTSLLQGTNTQLLLSMQTTNETVKWLQEEVRRNKNKVKDGGTVGVIGTVTSFSATTATTILPVNKSDSLPTYITQQTDSTWIVYKIIVKKDSTKFDLKVKNKYSVIFGEERVKGKLFKKTPIAMVTNKNPYTQVTEMKVYEVKNKVRKRVSIGIGGGVGFGSNNILKPEAQIGIHVQYNIINLW